MSSTPYKWGIIFTFSVRQDLEEDGYFGDGGEEEYEDGEPYAKAANLELSLGTL